jgi:RNA polymerase sigma-70 factor (ECF subfamily)
VSDQTALAEAFTRARPRLIRMAYGLLGSHSEAEDVVAECWLRLAAADAAEPVRDVEGWAVVAVARGALDTLRSARVRRETYVGEWLPEPLVPGIGGAPDPADQVTLDESISFALMVVLETLSPAERTAWVLHDVFGIGFTEVGQVVGRSSAAVRQLAARARRHLGERTPRIDVASAEHDAVVDAFSRATAEGDLKGLMAILDPAAQLTSDGGGQVSAARRPVVGADRIARYMLGVSGRVPPGGRVVPIAVNAATGLAVLDAGGGFTAVISLTTRGARIFRVDIVLAPEKLPEVSHPPGLRRPHGDHPR